MNVYILGLILAAALLLVPFRLAWIGRRDSTSHKHRLGRDDRVRGYRNEIGSYHVRGAES